MARIYHNPRCSKSRATLALLEENGIEADIVLYLQSPPNVEDLKSLAAALDCSMHDLMRSGEAVYKELGIKDFKDDEARLFEIVAANPILLERPIVIHGERAAVGRPPENVLALFS